MTIEVDIPEVIAEVTEAHKRYETALTENDLDTLDTLFWKDHRTLRYAPNGTLLGHAAISAFRRSRTGHTVRRAVQALHVTSFGRDFAVTNQESIHAASGQTTRQSQSWIRTAEGWKIVSAHVSDQPTR